MPFTANGDYTPLSSLEAIPESLLERSLRALREDRIKANLSHFKERCKEMLSSYNLERDCPPVPSLGSLSCSYARSALVDQERWMLAYLAYQVAGKHRGEIGFNDQGEMIFHLVVERDDQQAQMDLITIEEIWIVLDPPSCLTVAYGG